ncbi:unnamed protein product [Paramecium primaurelia]|uniref:protein-tyrosine-phosphatase n=1 Tax=Paramecium primaurelia TaxID=5886 RepID=A0A8S1LU60_PARPR|nr:unnamed protein product [Paramecium primaurelia]
MFDPMYQSMNQILEESGNILWLGDCTAAYDRSLLDGKGIKTVLTVASGLNVSYSEGGMVHKVYHILDIESSNIARLFPETSQQITEGLKRGGVLVHCAAGVSRSASVVIAFIMKTKGWLFQEAFEFVRKRRSVVFPNYGFQRQLRNYEKDLKQSKIQVNLDTPIKQTQKFQQEVQKEKVEQLEQKVKTMCNKTNFLTPQKQHQKLRQPFQSAKVNYAKQYQVIQNSTRASSSVKSNLVDPQFNFTNQGPMIISYQQQRKKGVEKMPEINKKNLYK